MSSASLLIRPRLQGASSPRLLCRRCARRQSTREPWRALHCRAQASEGETQSEPDDLAELPVAKSSEQLRSENNQADALIRSLEKVSIQQGREPRTRNVVLGDNHDIDSWRELDKKVNTYPHRRTFKAIGEGGNNFASSMQAAVEDVLGPVDPDFIHQRISSGRGAYISVSIGPVTVHNSEQVIGVYSAMSQDSRLKFYF